jgi:hypothetical protein
MATRLQERRAHPESTPVRAVFVLYLVLICAGIVFCSVIGLTHH